MWMKFSLLNLSVVSYTADPFLPLQILYFCEYCNTVNTHLTATTGNLFSMSSSSFSAYSLNVGVPQSPIPLHLCAPSGRPSFNQHQDLWSHIYITDLFFHSHSRPYIFVSLTSPESQRIWNPTCSRHNESFIILSQIYLPLLGSWLLTSYSTQSYKPESQEPL